MRPTTPCVVANIIDGDTVHCDQLGTVRMLGMDTPERTHRPYGVMAADALANMLFIGDTVRIERDVRDRDQFGRQLGYIWKDSTLINLQMVQDGWAITLRLPPNSRYDGVLEAAEREARQHRLGLWAMDGFDCELARQRRTNC